MVWWCVWYGTIVLGCVYNTIHVEVQVVVYVFLYFSPFLFASFLFLEPCPPWMDGKVLYIP